MATRRDAREWAVQLLFQLDMNPAESDRTFATFWKELSPDPVSREFTEALVRGVMENLAAIDKTLADRAENWDIRRMGVVDRNVLRLAIYEIQFRPDIPAAVSINEAVDLAKYFSTVEAGKFVNGILDKIRLAEGR